jgi:hypothetical protein
MWILAEKTGSKAVDKPGVTFWCGAKQPQQLKGDQELSDS